MGLAMCGVKSCERAERCARHPASGAVPAWFQSWFAPRDTRRCEAFVEAGKRTCPPCDGNCDQGRDCPVRGVTR